MLLELPLAQAGGTNPAVPLPAAHPHPQSTSPHPDPAVSAQGQTPWPQLSQPLCLHPQGGCTQLLQQYLKLQQLPKYIPAKSSQIQPLEHLCGADAPQGCKGSSALSYFGHWGSGAHLCSCPCVRADEPPAPGRSCVCDPCVPPGSAIVPCHSQSCHRWSCS